MTATYKSDEVGEPCLDLVPAPGRPPLVHADAWRDYLWERCRKIGQDHRRVTYVANGCLRILDPGAEVGKWMMEDIHGYEIARRDDGVMGSTIKRELSLLQAALNHALHRERVERVPHFEMPTVETGHRRPLTEEELDRLLASKLPRRIWLFYFVARWTGHRSRAIETLKWDRVDFQRRLINFNEPGARRTNKRRNGAYPIPDELYVVLVGAKKWADRNAPNDPYVIGLGPRGKCSTTVHRCKLALRAIGIDERGICRHTVRKTFATTRVLMGIPRPIVAKLIADSPATMDRNYFLPDSEDLRDAANMRLH